MVHECYVLLSLLEHHVLNNMLMSDSTGINGADYMKSVSNTLQRWNSLIGIIESQLHFCNMYYYCLMLIYKYTIV